MALTKLTLLALAALTVALPEPAEMVPQLARRAPYAGGGFALVTASTCPAGYQSLGDVGLTVCCPPGTEQTGSSGPPARSCCPTSMYPPLQPSRQEGRGEKLRSSDRM
jgi:hypothetical protein